MPRLAMEKLVVSLVIPNWNGKELLEKNLPLVIAASKDASEIIVVDDGSTDGSASFLRTKFPKIKLIEKKKHEGFVSAVNRGVRQAKGDIVVLLNTDVAPEEGYMPPLITHFSNPEVFAVGCEDLSRENDLTVLRGRGEAAWIRGFFIHWRGEVDKTDTVWISGGSGAFRKVIWEKLGGMDSLFNPFYWEDIDISYRALKSGYRLVFEPKSKVNHFHETGKIMKEYSRSYIEKIAYRNQFVFIWKDLSDPAIFTRHLLWTPIRLIKSLFSGNLNMFFGFFMAVLELPKIISARQKTSRFWVKRDRDIVPIK